MFMFYQSFFVLASHNVLKGTEYWTPRNVANGLNALAICIEIVFFSGFMWWAYTSKEYQRKPGMSATRIWRPLWDSYVLSTFYYHRQIDAWDRINFSDFDRKSEIVESLKIYVDCRRGKPSTRSRLVEEDEAFGPWYKMEDRGGEAGSLVHLRSSEQ
ncbi:hypothetical protein M378DRAFT_174465 [Amanita muscaria Koide BX008]|uniref:Uncharacterized protein n=1 Tax=Amanita muscaria (strain Koide BX008) TaxID=946122 RepID=A0A0C2WDF6_AMAMK|nr:hypothetical protein M378DRAFT_174465 [Amanita muscaria Koide BX008]